MFPEHPLDWLGRLNEAVGWVGGERGRAWLACYGASVRFVNLAENDAIHWHFCIQFREGGGELFPIIFSFLTCKLVDQLPARPPLVVDLHGLWSSVLYSTETQEISAETNCIFHTYSPFTVFFQFYKAHACFKKMTIFAPKPDYLTRNVENHISGAA
jgi:hypothetical protein